MRRAVVVLAMSAVVLAGCGSSSDKPPAASPSTVSAPQGGAAAPGALVAASYNKITEAKTAKLDLKFQLTSGSPGGQGSADIRFGGSGVQDFAAKKAQLTIEDPSGSQIEERLIGTTIYTKLPPAAAASPRFQGKAWLKADLNKAAQQAGLGDSGAGQNTDPSQILQLLTSVSNKVEEVGPEQVRGVQTRHFRVTVDLGKQSAAQGNSPQQIQRLQQLLGTSTMPVDVWVDDQGLPHRLQFQLPLPKAVAGQSGMQNAKMVATEEFYDFGTPVDVSPPPADQTVDVLSLARPSGTGSRSRGA